MKRSAIGLCVLLSLSGSAMAQTLISPPGPGAWPLVINAPGSYALTANFNAPATFTAISITGSNVTLDLRGYVVSSSSGTSCNPNTSLGYGTKCASAFGSPLINVTGQNVAIRNGTVTGSGGNGIQVTAASPNGVMLSDLRITNNLGSGISVNGSGAIIQNVSSTQNASQGIWTFGHANIENVNVSWNGDEGLVSFESVASKVVSNNNGLTGIFVYGSINSVASMNNNTANIGVTGVASGAYATGSSPSSIGGILIDSLFGIGGIVNVTGCYAQTRFIGGVSGGTPMTSNVCP